MKKYIILIVCLIINMFELHIVADNTYNTSTYERPYVHTYNYIPFKSTSSNIQNINYNTVKPLNYDGTVSIEYTTYNGVYKPKYYTKGLDVDKEDEDAIGELTPIGNPITPLLLMTLIYLCYHKNKKLNKEKTL